MPRSKVELFVAIRRDSSGALLPVGGRGRDQAGCPGVGRVGDAAPRVRGLPASQIAHRSVSCAEPA